jgi:hypothetical protein
MPVGDERKTSGADDGGRKEERCAKREGGEEGGRGKLISVRQGPSRVH